MLGIDIKVDSRQVKDAKQHIDMLNRSLNDTQSLGDLTIGEDGLPLASQRLKEMAEQVRRLQALSRQGTTRGGLLDPKQFREAQEHMRRLNGTVQDYAKTLYSVRNEMLQLSKAQIDMRRSGQANTPEFKANRERIKQLQDERRELEAQERSVRKLGAQGSAAADDITGMGQNQGRGGYNGLKKALGWTLAAAGGFSLLGFLSQSRAKYQQSVGHEATLSARGINGGFGDNVGIGVGPLEQMALLESISQQAGMGGRRANRAANLSGAFGRYAGVDPSQVASLYGSMYQTTGNANLATGAINMMGEAIKKGMDKAKTTELLTLVSRNTQVTAAAMHGAGATNAQAGAATAMAIEAILAHQGGASFGQYAKSQEFMNVMQNGLQGAGTGAGDIRLFSAMGGFDGPMTWEKIHEMNVLKQGGFMQSPELMSKIVGGLSGSKEARAGQLETMMASWGIKGTAAEKLIEMNDSGFFGRLAKATNGGAKKIESLQHGTKEERALYDEYKRNASSIDGVNKLSLEAKKEVVEIEVGKKIHDIFGQFEHAALDFAKTLSDKDWKEAFGSLAKFAADMGPIGQMMLAGAALNVGASVMNMMPGGKGKAIAKNFAMPALVGLGAYAGTKELLDYFTDGQYGKNTSPSYKASDKGKLRYIAEQHARVRGVDPNIIKGIIQAESGYNPQAVSRTGAKGLMQLMPGTAEDMGVRDPFDPQQNIAGGTKFYKKMLQKYDGDTKKALAAYNAGPGNVDKAVAKYGKDWLQHMLPETRSYVPTVMGYAKAYAGMYTEEQLERNPLLGAAVGEGRDKQLADKLQPGKPSYAKDEAVSGPYKDHQWEMLQALRSIDGKLGGVPVARPRAVSN